MKLSNPPKTLSNGSIEPAHDVEAVCLHCGYDLDAAEIAADTCADCGKPLELKQNVAIQVTTLPPMFGGTM
jgi:DNA-directed RNA polymerase subunit RPC12/RpoP